MSYRWIVAATAISQPVLPITPIEVEHHVVLSPRKRRRRRTAPRVQWQYLYGPWPVFGVDMAVEDVLI